MALSITLTVWSKRARLKFSRDSMSFLFENIQIKGLTKGWVFFLVKFKTQVDLVKERVEYENEVFLT